jgi:23S rRNA pseudouridine2605 synthase
MIRLQKVMAERGVASRRRAEELISEGHVRVDGELVTTLGTRVAEDARIEVDGRPVAAAPPHRYVILNKPVGIVSTAQDERGRRTVIDQVAARERLYPVGRLDTDSEGLLLLTNDGAWAERVLHPRYGHEREYDVWVEGDLTDEALARLQGGVQLEEGMARAVRIAVRSRSRGRSRLSLVLLTGWKRQVRRMCLAVGLKVTRLVRVRMGPLELGKLRPGEFRDLTKKEIDGMSAATAKPTPRARAEKARSIVPTRPESVRERAPRAASRQGGWVAALPVTRRAAIRSRPAIIGNARGVAPRVTRRATVSRARVEGPRRQRYGGRAVQAGRPTRERDARAAAGPAVRPGWRAGAGLAARPGRRAAAGPAARPPQWRRSTRAAAQRAAPRRAPR